MIDLGPADTLSEPQYKKFCKFFIFTFIALYMFTMIFGFFFQHIYEVSEYPMWKHSKDTISNPGQEIQKILVIGDSRIKSAFKPSVYNEKMLNISVGGATPIEGYYALKNYLEHNPEPENIVVSYAPLHFVMEGTFWHRSIRYRYLSADEYNEIKHNAELLNNNTLGEFRRWKYYFVPTMYWHSIFKGIKKKRWGNYDRVYASMKSEKGHTFFGKKNGSSGKNPETELTTFKESKLIELYFIKLIELAAENDINIFWYTVAFNNSSCDAIEDSFIENFNQYIFSFNQYGIQVINGISCMDNKYFGDPSHIYSGVNMVTRNIVNAVNERNLLKNTDSDLVSFSLH